jgi:hypothetical protein
MDHVTASNVHDGARAEIVPPSTFSPLSIYLYTEACRRFYVYTLTCAFLSSRIRSRKNMSKDLR